VKRGKVYLTYVNTELNERAVSEPRRWKTEKAGFIGTLVPFRRRRESKKGEGHLARPTLLAWRWAENELLY